MTVNFEKISLTARLTAYMRQYSDIPFAKDVASRLRAEEAFEKLLRDNELSPKDLLWYAPILEVRYKSVAETIRKSRATQVLELASGFSLRGLAVTQHPKVTYVESDLEGLTDEKASLVADLRRQYRLPEHGNLHLVTADALDRNQLQFAAKSFRRDQPIAVVNEGLLQYLSATEMVMVARNIRDLLAEFDGVWITPDFSVKQDVTDVSEQQRRFRRVWRLRPNGPCTTMPLTATNNCLPFLTAWDYSRGSSMQLMQRQMSSLWMFLNCPIRYWIRPSRNSDFGF